MEDLLLTREKLDEIENNPIFTLWLFGNIDESKLTEDENDLVITKLSIMKKRKEKAKELTLTMENL